MSKNSRFLIRIPFPISPSPFQYGGDPTAAAHTQEISVRLPGTPCHAPAPKHQSGPSDSSQAGTKKKKM